MKTEILLIKHGSDANVQSHFEFPTQSAKAKGHDQGYKFILKHDGSNRRGE